MVDSCLGTVENRFLGVISFLGDGGESMLVKLGGIMGCRVSLGRGVPAYILGAVRVANLWS